MAYMNQEQKKQRAPQIKKVLKKYGLKGTIGVRNYSTLYVTIKEGALDFIGAAQTHSGIHVGLASQKRMLQFNITSIDYYLIN